MPNGSPLRLPAGMRRTARGYYMTGRRGKLKTAEAEKMIMEFNKVGNSMVSSMSTLAEKLAAVVASPSFGAITSGLAGATVGTEEGVGNKLIAAWETAMAKIREGFSSFIKTQAEALSKTFVGRIGERAATIGGKVKEKGGEVFGFLKYLGGTKQAKLAKKVFGRGGMLSKGFTSLQKGADNFIGFIVTLLEKMGVMQPIMEILNTIFEMIGGAVMEALMPALQILIEVITDPEFTGMLMEIGKIIGEILSPIITIFAEVLMMLMPVILAVVEAIGTFLTPIIEAFLPVIDALGPVFASLLPIFEALKPIIEIFGKVLGVVLAGAFIIIGNVIIGIVNLILMGLNILRALFFQPAIPLLSFMSLPALAEGGIVTRPTVALIGEAGPEKVTPLKKGGRGNGGDINLTLEGGVYTQNIDELATMVARKIRLYRW